MNRISGGKSLKKPNPKRIEPRIDFLKNFRICRYWVKNKYDLGISDLEIILFLYTEQVFTRNKFEEYRNIMPWQANYFKKMKEKELISIWRERKYREAALWELSFKGKRIVREFYSRLTGEVLISERPHSNRTFKEGGCYTNKVFAHATKQANKDTIKQRLRHAQE